MVKKSICPWVAVV